ncbi:asparagine synthase (glutamine-hydrolyzing) [Spiribacter sp. C176]|uniref:asparagine synthase (glutamine-hydrolyzing) n=1 Tax=Spiribacter salilacus TaxID=2664894 RepID=A0A6N7QTR2_9GAMM|nr:asparagine synthase (glutamine-hydrolyzing) [Spiribacter salilacus]MRH78528.1 asparagine synthase (glutamine-hydrolyzing) [Spiribacter salilacus]
MCGLAGFIDFSGHGDESLAAVMANTLTHRGPDDSGVWVGDVGNARIGLGHRRLSIIDIRPESAQPMSYGGFQIVYNGEIYNYAEVRDALTALGHVFQTHSDTEVLLHAFAQWGPACVKRLIGMFAFVVVDTHAAKIHFFRDRAGVKPIYIYQKNGLCIFGSELKALHVHPGFEKQIDEDAFSRYFDYGYVPSGQCIFRDAKKLQPGTYETIDLVTGSREVQCYWSVEAQYQAQQSTIDYPGALEQLGGLLDSACRYRMVADVPVGLFLSGGYDSTAVLASLAQSSSHPIKAFTIGFETGNNELPQAQQIAAHLGAEHYAYTCTEHDARAIIPDLPETYDEPFADSSAIPTTLVSRFAAGHVKVALSADGGDETFYGYTSYAQLGRRIAKLRRLPSVTRRPIAAVLRASASVLPATKIRQRQMLQGLGAALHEDDRTMAARLHVVARQLPRDYRRALFMGFCDAERVHGLCTTRSTDVLDEAAAWDYANYLVDDILVKVDRATMSASLEGREPLLDHRLAEFAARLPISYKYDGGRQKRILKDYVHQYVPEKIMAGPKRGFTIPVLRWLREDLSDLLDEHLSAECLAESGLFNVGAVVQLVEDFRQNRVHYTPLIWKLLMFQMWYQRWMKA